MNQTRHNINIGIILVGLLFGIIGGVGAYKYLDYPLSYTDFIASSITWGGVGKSKEVFMVFGFIFVTVTSLYGLNRIHHWIKKEYDERAACHLSIVLIYCSLPFVIWSGEQILSKDIPYYSLLAFNIWVVMGGLLSSVISLRDANINDNKINSSVVITLSFIIITLSALSPYVITVILMKAGVIEPLTNAWLVIPVLWMTGLLFIKSKIVYYKYSMFVFQLITLGYFALLIPSPYIENGLITYYTIKSSLYIVVAVLILSGVYDIYTRYIGHLNKPEISLSLLSPYPFSALLILIFLSYSPVPAVSTDDYHYGEILLPFYMIAKYQIIPYADYALAHGFMDLVSATGSNLFLDGTASTLGEGNRIFIAVVVVGFFLVTYHYTGLLVACLLSMFVIPVGISYMAIILMSLILIEVKASRLGVSYFIVSVIAILLAPGQGAVFAIAAMPLVLYRAWSSHTVVSNIKSGGISFILLVILTLFIPWTGDMLVGAVKYVIENGPINYQAYGISWNYSWDASKALNSSLAVYEIIRTSWVFLPVIIYAFWLSGHYKHNKNKDALFYGIFAAVFILLMHKYSLGRIDPFGLTRLGIVSKVSIPLLLLSVFYLNPSKQKFAYWVIISAFWFGLLTPSYLNNPVISAKRAIPHIGPLTRGSEIDIPNLGNGQTDSEHINSIVDIKNIADVYLDNDETYIDITNRGALYYYLDRLMPIEAVPYNQPHSNMQQRSVNKLSANPPPMALLMAGNVNHDGRSVSIRTHQLYRWLVSNYIPVTVNEIIIGVHKNYTERFRMRFPDITLFNSIEEQLELWDKVFLLYDLQQLPNSWGVSKKTLSGKMKTIQNIDSVRVVIETKKAIEHEESGALDITDKNWTNGIANEYAGLVLLNTTDNKARYELHSKLQFKNGDIRKIINITLSHKYMNIYLDGEPMDGKVVGYPNNIYVIRQEYEPFVLYDISQYNISGDQAGLLNFDFTCDKKNNTELAVYWSADTNPITEKTVIRFNAHNGNVIVPLDAMPRWLTVKHLATLRINLQNPDDCETFTVNNVNLNQRILNAQ